MMNESLFDRGIRTTIGAAFVGLFFFAPSQPWSLLGLYPFVTGVLGYDPIYSLLKIRTNTPGEEV